MSKSMTLAEVIATTGTEVYDYLDRDATVPVVTTAACQGDISFLRVTTKAAVKPVPVKGVVLASGQGGHDHTLHGAGILFDFAERNGDVNLVVGTLTVPVGKEALVSHQEHGALLIEPGTYRIGRQREFAGEWREVAD